MTRKTGQDGFLRGMVLGTIALFTILLNFDFPFIQQIKVLTLILLGVTTILAFGLMFHQNFKRRAFVSPYGDGIVYGFTAVFDVIAIFAGLLSGKLFSLSV